MTLDLKHNHQHLSGQTKPYTCALCRLNLAESICEEAANLDGLTDPDYAARYADLIRLLGQWKKVRSEP